MAARPQSLQTVPYEADFAYSCACFVVDIWVQPCRTMAFPFADRRNGGIIRLDDCAFV